MDLMLANSTGVICLVVAIYRKLSVKGVTLREITKLKQIMGYYLGIACQGNLALPNIVPPVTTVDKVLEIIMETNDQVVAGYIEVAERLAEIGSFPISHENEAFSALIKIMPRPSDLRLPLLVENGFDISEEIHPEAIYNLVMEEFSKDNKDHILEKS